MHETFSDLPCVTGTADDIVVYGYNSCLAILMKTFVLFFSMVTGLVFASTWTNIDSGAPKFSSFGHIIGAEGLQPEPQKIDSMLSMDPSTSLADLQTFPGMV